MRTTEYLLATLLISVFAIWLAVQAANATRTAMNRAAVAVACAGRAECQP